MDLLTPENLEAAVIEAVWNGQQSERVYGMMMRGLSGSITLGNTHVLTFYPPDEMWSISGITGQEGDITASFSQRFHVVDIVRRSGNGYDVFFKKY